MRKAKEKKKKKRKEGKEKRKGKERKSHPPDSCKDRKQVTSDVE